MHGDTQILAWHGFSMTIPASWNPIRIDGDGEQGSLLLADLVSPKLGIRWRKAPRDEPASWAARALRDEVGEAASAGGRPAPVGDDAAWAIARVARTTEPAARDVMVGWSRASGRVVEIVYNCAGHNAGHNARQNARHNGAPDDRPVDDLLERTIIPTLRDTAGSSERDWSIFGFALRTPPALRLHAFAFNAGDVSMTFAAGRNQTTVRRVSPASLAVARRPLESWLRDLQRPMRKMFRPPVRVVDDSITAGPAVTDTIPAVRRSLPAIRAVFTRRRRLCWAWFVPGQLNAIAAEDVVANRLLLGCSPDEELLQNLIGQLLQEPAPAPAALRQAVA